MNITKTLRNLVISVFANVEEDNRLPLYEAILDSFDSEDLSDLDADSILEICPVFDEFIQTTYPDLFFDGSLDEDEEDDDELGYIDSIDDERYDDED